jgi:hypothetical protein
MSPAARMNIELRTLNIQLRIKMNQTELISKYQKMVVKGIRHLEFTTLVAFGAAGGR